MCPTCGEDIDSGEFLKNNKCFCSDECMRRENLSSFSEHSPITVMQNFVRLFVSQSLIYSEPTEHEFFHIRIKPSLVQFMTSSLWIISDFAALFQLSQSKFGDRDFRQFVKKPWISRRTQSKTPVMGLRNWCKPPRKRRLLSPYWILLFVLPNLILLIFEVKEQDRVQRTVAFGKALHHCVSVCAHVRACVRA